MSTSPKRKDETRREWKTRQRHRKTDKLTKEISCGDPTSTRYGISSLLDYSIENNRRTSLMKNLQTRTYILSFLKEIRLKQVSTLPMVTGSDEELIPISCL
jgi:WD40 repeat protein